MSSILVPVEEFTPDLGTNLGNANGNVYHRRQGVEGVHDGQIMVRLKKKRFIVIDYSVEPTEADIQAAQGNPHIKIMEGAGKAICITPNCNKIGVPVCLYDSEPGETDSLYLRSGMCFTCQRNLNEKRRTERKRVSKSSNAAHSSDGDGSPSLLYAIGPCQKKFKINGSTILLNADATIVNGSIDGARQCGEGYGFQEIGADIQALARESLTNVDTLINAVSGNAGATVEPMSAEAAANAVVEASSGLIDGETHDASPSSINALYDRAFKSLNKSIYLLTQWKTSWDAAVEHAADPSLADAVASAAAVVAAAADGHDQGSNMVSLLLAAEKRKKKTKTEPDTGEVGEMEEV